MQHLDAGTIAVIILTLALFILSVFLKGITHDLLLEGGVFLVSVKLILLSYHNSVSTQAIQSKLDQIYDLVRQPQKGDSAESAASDSGVNTAFRQRDLNPEK